MVRVAMSATDTLKAIVKVERPHATEENPVVIHMSPVGTASRTKAIYQANGSLMIGDTAKMTKEERQTLIKEKNTYEKLYATTNISRLGWFNCDGALKALATDVKVRFAPSDSIVAAEVYLIFKNINSVIGGTYISSVNDSTDLILTNAPVGYNVRALAFAVKGDNIFAYASNISIEKDMTLTPKLKQVSEEEFGKMLNGN